EGLIGGGVGRLAGFPDFGLAHRSLGLGRGRLSLLHLLPRRGGRRGSGGAGAAEGDEAEQERDGAERHASSLVDHWLPQSVQDAQGNERNGRQIVAPSRIPG